MLSTIPSYLGHENQRWRGYCPFLEVVFLMVLMVLMVLIVLFLQHSPWSRCLYKFSLSHGMEGPAVSKQCVTSAASGPSHNIYAVHALLRMFSSLGRRTSLTCRPLLQCMADDGATEHALHVPEEKQAPVQHTVHVPPHAQSLSLA